MRTSAVRAMQTRRCWLVLLRAVWRTWAVQGIRGQARTRAQGTYLEGGPAPCDGRGQHRDVPQLGLLAKVALAEPVRGLGWEEACGDLLLDLLAEPAADDEGAEDDGAGDKEEDEEGCEEGQTVCTQNKVEVS